MPQALRLLICLLIISPCSSTWADESTTVILQDDFNRDEENPELEQVGNGWGTNSRSRAQGVKQVDLRDGALFIKMADVADHGVSVTHDLQFTNAEIQLRFQLGKGDDLGINIADLQEKSVHAGHICMARIRPYRLEIVDLKTGRMNLELRAARMAGTLTAAQQELIQQKSKFFPLKLKLNDWHQLSIRIEGTRMTVSIDGQEAGSFDSPGIGHPTKSRLRLAVNREAWVDDVRVVRLPTKSVGSE